MEILCGTDQWKALVTIGACVTAGGIQTLRNFKGKHGGVPPEAAVDRALAILLSSEQLPLIR
jgi:hypothetical protein